MITKQFFYSSYWERGNGEWGMGNGEWGMGNGEWAMGNGEWAMGNGQWAMGNATLIRIHQNSATDAFLPKLWEI
ncbi:hypothetical protein FDUTEX481_00478 [Tolypothrix sp. PCC 7601]|nr:hypothetical protein FDUTEX481_00478 [Tolypothrix sp. PCC 7601]